MKRLHYWTILLGGHQLPRTLARGSGVEICGALAQALKLRFGLVQSKASSKNT
jgi:hypothetical protein